MKKSLLALAACAMMASTADAMYIVGDPAGKWSPSVGIKMDEVDGGWKWTGTITGGQWFAFATQLLESDDWGTFNSTYRLNPTVNETVAEVGGYDLVLGGADKSFKGCGEEVTYYIKEKDGAYTLKVTLPGADPDEEVAPLYIVGQVGGSEWSPAKGVKMMNVEGGWKWTGFVGPYDYFCFATQLVDFVEPEDPEDTEPWAKAWEEFNENYRLSPVVPEDNEDGNNLVAEAGEYALRFGAPEGAFHGTGNMVTYFVQEVEGAYTLTVTEEKTDWGVVGSFNGWGNDGDFPMTQIRPGVWKATLYDFSGEFKFRANNSWDLNFGPAGVSEIEADGVYPVGFGGSNFNVPEEVEEIIFELDVINQTLTVDGLTPSFLALRSNMVDWAFEWSYLFQEVDEGVYMLYLDGIDAEWEFKIADQDWNECYTTGVKDMTAGEIYPLVENGQDNNMGVDNAYTEVTMFLNVDEGYVTFYGELAAVEAVNEIATGKARFYNLQGVEVTNPSNGIYVRVRNGKSEKINVK